MLFLNNPYHLKLDKTYVKFSPNALKITFSFDDFFEEYNIEYLGFFDINTKIWMWAWLPPYVPKESTKFSKDLFKYGIELAPKPGENDLAFIKTQLTNSRFILEDSFQLDMHLSLCSYLGKNRIKFIYKFKYQSGMYHYFIIK